MQATYRLKPSELNDDFVKIIRKLFKGDEIEITISTPSEKKKKEEFMKAVEDVRLRKNLVDFSVDEFKSFSEKLASK
jgi:hypothetical protein